MNWKLEGGSLKSLWESSIKNVYVVDHPTVLSMRGAEEGSDSVIVQKVSDAKETRPWDPYLLSTHFLNITFAV